MGNVINPAITDLKTLVLYAVVPFNILKGAIVSVMVLMIYKKLSPILHR
jgi:riboflavin transporter FmnP